MSARIKRLNRYIRGYMAYFRLADTPNKFTSLDESFRRRMRQIRWKEWKRPRTRVANLERLGLRPAMAWQWGMTSKACWRIAKSPILHRPLRPTDWQRLGLLFLHDAGRQYRTT